MLSTLPQYKNTACPAPRWHWKDNVRLSMLAKLCLSESRLVIKPFEAFVESLLVPTVDASKVANSFVTRGWLSTQNYVKMIRSGNQTMTRLKPYGTFPNSRFWFKPNLRKVTLKYSVVASKTYFKTKTSKEHLKIRFWASNLTFKNDVLRLGFDFQNLFENQASKTPPRK